MKKKDLDSKIELYYDRITNMTALNFKIFLREQRKLERWFYIALIVVLVYMLFEYESVRYFYVNTNTYIDKELNNMYSNVSQYNREITKINQLLSYENQQLKKMIVDHKHIYSTGKPDIKNEYR